ncbi:MAG: NapC/NirT family cytochrome c [Halieaceae bacterium]|nr:NapC/NirT family cytochrome c [Halieaceae bacterium]
MLSLRILLAALLLAGTPSYAQQVRHSSTAESAACLACHDFGPDSPVHAVLAGSHGLSGDDEAMAGRRGCPDCHGDSGDHVEHPTTAAPEVSFGPRWTSTAAAQDAKCLACHEQDSARNWRHALHMLNNVTCVTCHDLLTWEDRVLVADRQAEVCTTCHKAQQQGVHGIAELASANPPCSGCHNPHDHESAQAQMLANGSAGCLACHDLFSAGAAAGESTRAHDYHQVAARPGHTCNDCHQGIAHAPADAVTAMVPQARASGRVTLFYPGNADSEWLLRDHPGSQPLRQGSNCQQCHRGDEARMGATQSSGQLPAVREMQVSFARSGDQLVITLTWQGSGEDRLLALMWGDSNSDAFSHGGCFAACHADLPGRPRDRGQQLGKYLWGARRQGALPGEASTPRPAPERAQLMADGDYATLWELPLEGSELRLATVLDGLDWLPGNLIQINKTHVDGRWTVELRAPLNNTGIGKPFTVDEKYTFGIALGGAGNPGGQHWVSLPLAFSFAGDETDFKVEQQ